MHHSRGSKPNRQVWLFKPGQFVYLRETLVLTLHPRGPIGFKGQNWVRTLEALRATKDARLIVGYEETRERGAPYYVRRMWWIRSYDRDIDHGGIYAHRHPTEAVFPLSISIKGQSKRLWGVSNV